jgi:aminoglycoside phosphotransferase (APT) family kinase protein
VWHGEKVGSVSVTGIVGADQYRDRVALVAELLGRSAEEITLLGSGADHLVFAVGDDLVARFAIGDDDDAAELTREAGLLHSIADRVPVPVPHVVDLAVDCGLLVTTRVRGESLLGRARPSTGTIDAIADVVAALHAIPVTVVAEFVGDDPFPLASFAGEAIDNLAQAASRLENRVQRAVSSALREVPDESATTVFVHNDFGAEHLFADADGVLTGVIDWADAAIADPARDFARLLRDFGPEAYRRVVQRYPHGWDEQDGARAWFLARCAALEDLAFGLEAQRDPYVAAALRSMSWLFES